MSQMVDFITRYIHSKGKLAVGWVWCHYPQLRRQHCKENGLVSGVNIVVWGLGWGPQGPSWPIYGPSPQARWGERRKGAFGSFERVLLVLTLLESG